jgi:hypothetical protein
MTSDSPVDPSLVEWAEYWYPISWKGLLVFGAITALAAVGTIVFSALQWRTTVIRERQSDWRTAQLEFSAEQLRATNLALEERIAPRTLQPAQQVDLSNALRKLAGKKVGVLSYSFDLESARFAKQIVGSFLAAGVIVDDGILSLSPNQQLVFGLQVSGDNQDITQLIAASLASISKMPVAVRDQMQAFPGIYVRTTPRGVEPDARVLVGVKPLPTMP